MKINERMARVARRVFDFFGEWENFLMFAIASLALFVMVSFLYSYGVRKYSATSFPVENFNKLEACERNKALEYVLKDWVVTRGNVKSFGIDCELERERTEYVQNQENILQKQKSALINAK